MRLFSSICVLLWTALSLVNARSAAGNRLLVVQEDATEKELYSQLWSDLKARSFELTFESPKAEGLSLFKLGVPAYDHILLLPPKSKGYGPNLTPRNLLEFTNAGGNILLGLSSESPTPTAISSLLLEFDISLPIDRASQVVDHFNYDTTVSTEDHSILVLPRPNALRPDVINFFGGDGVLAVPKAVPQILGNTSPLINVIFKAPSTSYIHNPKEEADAELDISATGSQIALVSAMQARNDARFTVLGSLEMLQNKWFDASVTPINRKASKTVNREFARQLTAWTFKEVGVLKVGRVEHYEVLNSKKSGTNSTKVGNSDPGIYRIKTDVAFSFELSQWKNDGWAPYTAPAADAIQLEFTMLSPFHRLNLQPTVTRANSTVYSTSFTTPDQHGIFAFKVNYKRPFLTSVEEKRQVTVRHFAHDEWPRSFVITAAYPWVTGLWAVIAGFVLFVGMWLYCEPPRNSEVEKLKKETS